MRVRDSDLPRCKDCGDKVCVCEHEGMWAAHCRTCNNAIGNNPGYYDPCANSKNEAIVMWIKLNTKE